MERARNAKLDRAPGSLTLGLVAGFVDRRRLAGDDELTGAVVVRRPDVRDLAAQTLDHLVGEAEDRRHRAGMLPRLGHGLRNVLAHPCLDGPLAGKHEGDLAHARAPVVSCVQRINAEPHVRPAPMPVKSTSLPDSSRPSSAASASASGIDPDDVLPYRSTFTTVLPAGTPSFLTAWSMIRTFAWCGT